MRRRRFLVVALVGVAVTAVVLFFWERAGQRLVVDNQSGQAVVFLEVTVGGQVRRFGEVAPGKEITAATGLRGGELIQLRGQLADGTRISGRRVLGTALPWEPARVRIQLGGHLDMGGAGR